jgi:hypothetical protein
VRLCGALPTIKNRTPLGGYGSWITAAKIRKKKRVYLSANSFEV